MNDVDEMMNKLKEIYVEKLKEIQTYPSQVLCKSSFDVSPHFHLNYCFKKEHEKELFIKEYLRKKKFVHSYTILRITNYVIVKETYGLDKLVIKYYISKKELINHYIKEFEYYDI